MDVSVPRIVTPLGKQFRGIYTIKYEIKKEYKSTLNGSDSR